MVTGLSKDLPISSYGHSTDIRAYKAILLEYCRRNCYIDMWLWELWMMMMMMLMNYFCGMIERRKCVINPLSANPQKWSISLKQFVGKLPTNCLRGFDHFEELVLKGLSLISSQNHYQRFPQPQTSDTPQAGFEIAQNLSSGLVIKTA